MAKRPTRGKCVHCLTDDVERTWDHVFPVSWYPDSTPRDLEKWKVPSCDDCNHALGKLEDTTLQPLALCLDPFAPASASVVEKNLRSMRSSAGKDERDKAKREVNRRRLLDSMLKGEDIPLDGVYPGLGERWSRPREEQSAVLIPAGSFQRLAEKIVRGTVYRLDQRFIEPPYSVKFYAVDYEKAGEVRDLLKRAGKTYSMGPGFTVTRAVVPEDGLSSILQIDLWGGQVRMFAIVSRNDEGA